MPALTMTLSLSGIPPFGSRRGKPVSRSAHSWLSSVAKRWCLASKAMNRRFWLL